MAADTKERIIESALALFRDRGYVQVTIDEICKDCGITKPTFYYHLRSKDEIISHFYRDITQNLANHLLQSMGAENYWEQIMFCFETFMDTAEQVGPELFGQLFTMNLKQDQGTFDYDDDLTRMIVTVVERAQKSGQIRNQSPARKLYWACGHAYNGYELAWCIRKGGFDHRRVIRRALEDLFDVDPALRMASDDQAPIYEA